MENVAHLQIVSVEFLLLLGHNLFLFPILSVHTPVKAILVVLIAVGIALNIKLKLRYKISYKQVNVETLAPIYVGVMSEFVAHGVE